MHLRGHDWGQLGESFCLTLLELFSPKSEIVKRSRAQLMRLVPGKFKRSSISAGDVDSESQSDVSGVSRPEKSGGGRSSKGKRSGGVMPKRSKSRRSSSEDSSSKGRARTTPGRPRLKKKSSAKNK